YCYTGIMWDSESREPKVYRRAFLNQTATAIAEAARFTSSAFSYGRIKGANDRILLGHIGIGDRGSELAGIIARLKDKQNVEMSAVCDLWKVNRERAASKAQSVYGRAPQAFQYMQDL